MNERKVKVSISDVARRAQVSIATVSRVINKIPTVNEKNLGRVEEAIAELNYKPNAVAQRLARGVNDTIGLVMPGYPGIFYSFYAIELIRGIGHACESLRLDLVFHLANDYNPTNVGGIVFADIIENREQVELAIKDEIPCVVINNIAKDLDINYIGIDNIKGGYIATNYLISMGHKKIATVTGALQTQSGIHRVEGFKQSLEENGIPVINEYIFEGDYSRRSARIAAVQFLSLQDPPTAIFAASDDMALEIISVIMEKGKRVPEDISIIGFDDNPIGLYGPVALTTVKQPLFKMAEDAVYSLNEIISRKEQSSINMILAPELVLRDSCWRL